MKRLLTILAAAITLLAPMARAEMVAIQADQNGRYAAFHEGYLAARFPGNQAHVFDMIRLDGNRVAFRDPESGRFLRAGVTQSSLLALGESHIRGWETFELDQDGGTSTLRSVQNGRYVRAGIGPDTLFGATSQAVGGWEEFRIFPVGQPSQAAPEQRARVLPVDFAGAWEVTEIYSPAGQRASFNDRLMRQAEVTITDRGGVNLTAGCNTVNGELVQRGSSVSTGGFLTTRMNCANPAMDLERALIAAFEGATHFAGSHASFHLFDAGGRRLADFRAR